MPSLVSIPWHTYKLIDQSLTNSASLTDDADLQFQGVVNESYWIQYFLRIVADNATMDFKYGLVSPAGTTHHGWLAAGGGIGWCRTGIGSVPGDLTSTTLANLGTAALPVVSGGVIMAYVSCTANGAIKLQWAQNTADPGTLTVQKDSFMVVYRIR